MRVFLSEMSIDTNYSNSSNEYFSSAKNIAILLDSIYGNKIRFFHHHAPYPTRKSFVESLENKFSDIFVKTSSHHFRSSEDYFITNGGEVNELLWLN